MNRKKIKISTYFVYGIILSLGYSSIVHVYMTKLISFADAEQPRFPFILSSDIFIRFLVWFISLALAVGSSMIVPDYLAYYHLKFHEYMERREVYLAQKKQQSNDRNAAEDSSGNSNRNNRYEEMKNNVRSFLDHKRK